LLVHLFQKRNAPAAARSRPAAIGKLTRHFGPADSQEIYELSPRNVKAVTDFRIKIHRAASQKPLAISAATILPNIVYYLS
jgi:hypothetical protein